jgi:hypothetical protein
VLFSSCLNPSSVSRLSIGSDLDPPIGSGSSSNPSSVSTKLNIGAEPDAPISSFSENGSPTMQRGGVASS